ncbi:hypothetical protein GV829_04490 [Sphingomonas lacunae]|uniref:Uncharacterized protein n=1 Tax=Sphingomonas lacunae TaxID=2698828 RepID=A0A6M4ARY1_9SPHN|nr:hypothetical protein [Sphingomonas lacunae]QJQ31793.1 hypothetical protein GV829_04490 [Sphingomonas lacunae]
MTDTTPIRACRFCGCTEQRACVTNGEACHWTGPDICSACTVTRNGLTFLPIEPAAQDGRNYIVMDDQATLYRAAWLDGQWVYPRQGFEQPMAIERTPTHYHPRRD